MKSMPMSQPTRGRSRFRGMLALAALVVVLVAAGIAILIASHNNGSASPGVAAVGPTPTTITQSSAQGASTGTKAAAYSACMRSHGVPSFPDPDSQGHLMLKITKGSQLDPASPQFQSAQQACKSLAPSKNTAASSGQIASQGLKFAACMRAHGLPKFPDPKTSSGQFLITGIDPNSPQFQSAQQACQSLMPGGGPGAGQ